MHQEAQVFSVSQRPRKAKKTSAARNVHAGRLRNLGTPVRREPQDLAAQHCSSSEQAERRRLPCVPGERYVPHCCESIQGAKLEESEQSSGLLNRQDLRFCRGAPKILVLQRWGCEATKSGAPAGIPLR